MKDVPVAKTFVHKGKYYLYDTYTNRLINVTKQHYLELVKLQSMGIKDYLQIKSSNKFYKDVVMLINKGMLKSAFVDKIENSNTRYAPELIDRLVSGITLQVTKKCNFSCRYCVINMDNNIGRGHEQIDMSWEVAQNSIDFLYAHSKDASSITLAFYGGEPMLNFHLIAKIIEYAEEKFLTKTLKYMITINGSILTEDMIRFLSAHSVEIAISLDGPPTIQNKHRRFCKNGQGTFDVVYNNVKKIQAVDKDYYNKHVRFIPVMFRDESYDELVSFFSSLEKTEKDIFKLDVSLNGIDYLYSEELNMTGLENAGYDVKKTADKFMRIYNDKTMIPTTWHHNGPCTPIERILINTDGEINMCEKVESLKLGTIDTGLDLELVNNYMNIGKYTETECKSCWAMRFCDMCIMTCLDVDNQCISIDRKKENCKRTKVETLSLLKRCLLENKEEGTVTENLEI